MSTYKDIEYLSSRQKRRIKQKYLNDHRYSKISTVSNLDFAPLPSFSNATIELPILSSDNVFFQEDPTIVANAIDSTTNSESSSDSGDDIYELSAKEALSKWAIENNVTCTTVNNLLPVLKRLGLDVPLDYRTLLKTPREVELRDVAPGSYCHIGVESEIRVSLEKDFPTGNIPSLLKLNINVDGLPISKSSGSQFWPILGSIVPEDGRYTSPFVIGLYHGFSKPNAVNEFLKVFVNEMKRILNQGILFNGKLYQVCINAVICDAPAKSFVTMTKGHTGYFACSKCIQEGEFIQQRVTYPEINSTLRTDEKFNLKQYDEYHKGRSILEDLGIGMVSQILLDYMHLVCLGVMKRLLQFWIKGNAAVRWNNMKVDNLSMKLLSLRSCIPSEFARYPRSLKDVDRWKATEYRQFLLYTGLLILKSALPDNMYLHFLSLSCAIRILASDHMCHEHNEYANSLLIYFVEKYSTFYGPEHITHNVHNLVHLSADVNKFGNLNNFSAFKYEDYLYKLKKKVRSSSNPLQQAVKRIHEERHKIPSSRPISKKVITIKNYQFSKYAPNNCCLVGEDVILISNFTFVSKNQYYKISGKKYSNGKNLFTTPCESKLLGIQTINNEVFENIEFKSSDIKAKCLSLPYNNELLIIPLIH